MYLRRLVDETRKAIEEGDYDLNLRVYHPIKSLSQSIINCKYIPIISEIKFASPSLGKIREYEDPVKIAKEMVEGGAVGLSILTNRAFNGSLNYLLNVRVAVDLPLLMKDIIIDKKQIDAASRAGADCILLIYKVFDGYNEVDEFIEYAHKHNLEVLLEVHDKGEFDAALKSDADIIGINNRDLTTMKIDISTTEELLKDNSSLKNKIIISESGINTPEDIKRLYKRVKGFLVGTSIMKSNNIKDKLYALVRAV